jgi:hypothetical protein
MDAVRSSLRDPSILDDFAGLASIVAEKAKKLDASFLPEDLGRASLYRAVRIRNYAGVEIIESNATILLVCHELHTHMSFGADAVLTGITRMAQAYPTGIPLPALVEEVAKFLANKPGWETRKAIATVVRDLKASFSSEPGNVQYWIPEPNGLYGFETVQDAIEGSSDEAPGLIAWGAVALLQAACMVELFRRDWIQRTLPHHDKVFSSSVFLEELQTMPPGATIGSWLERVVEKIIEQHEDVANSKGLYARRFERVSGRIYHRGDAGYFLNRGRLSNAVAWLSDAALLKRKGATFQSPLEEG